MWEAQIHLKGFKITKNGNEIEWLAREEALFRKKMGKGKEYAQITLYKVLKVQILKNRKILVCPIEDYFACKLF